MLRRVIIGLAALVVLIVASVGLGLWLAKRAIAAIDPPLPTVEAVLAFDRRADLPVRLGWINTASQKMPRSAVLDASLDPTPSAPYVMSHPAFVLEWADGRMFLIDAGMDREAALAFGKPIEWLSGGEPIEPIVSTAERLGASVARVEGIAFTHEHTDHTSGVAALCKPRTRPIPLFQNPLQVQEANFTTRPGQRQLAEAGCLEPRIVESGPLFAVPGFSGLLFFAAAGHTPGSQVFVAHVRSTGAAVRTWVFTGDVVNQIDGVRQNIPKPAFYSAFVVPESTARLDAVRRFLAGLERDHGVGLLVSHDQLSIEASGISPY